MGKQYAALTDEHIHFIATQKIFFVATATETSRVNISPKGMESLVVQAPNRIAWLNVTGSGNETSAHVQACPRMTLMFCAFDGNPVILRLFGTARVLHRGDPEWGAMFARFKPLPGARQIFDVAIDLVQTSCGMSVPNFDYVGERELLNDWARNKGDAGIHDYWEKKNQLSIDGLPTNVLDKSG
jgi:hypothetical protein